MQIGNPYFLSLLWILPALIFFYLWAFKKKQALIERFVAPELKERLLKNTSFSRQRIKAILIGLACLFILLALIRPKWGFHWKEVKRRGVDILVALDVSESMLAKDVQPNRLERAKREIIDLVKIVEGDRMGLVAFAGASFLQCPLTLDYGAIQIFLDYLAPDLIPVPGTAIGAAIDEAIKAFEKTGKKSRALILITDGEDHTGKPIEAAKRAAKAGIRVYTVGIGKEGGAPIPNQEGGGFKKNRNGELILTKLDEESLQKVALETGGSYVRSVSGDLDLEKIYEDIKSSLEEKELKSGRQKRFEERFQWPLLLALLCLLLEPLLSERKKPLKPKKLAHTLALIFLLNSSFTAFASVRDGEKAYTQEKYSEALKHFLDAQIETPKDIPLKYNLANTYYKMGDYQKAEKLFESVAAQATPELSQKAFYNLGNTSYRQGKLEAALKHYEKALELNPKDPDAKFNLEFVREEIKKRIEQAKKTQQQQQQQQQQQGQQKDESQQGQQDPQQSAQNQPPSQQDQKGQNQKGNEEKQPPQENTQAQGGSQQNEKDQPKEGEEGASAQAADAKPMSKEEAELYLSTLKEDRKKFMKQQLQGQRRYRVEKDW